MSVIAIAAVSKPAPSSRMSLVQREKWAICLEVTAKPQWAHGNPYAAFDEFWTGLLRSSSLLMQNSDFSRLCSGTWGSISEEAESKRQRTDRQGVTLRVIRYINDVGSRPILSVHWKPSLLLCMGKLCLASTWMQVYPGSAGGWKEC